MTIIESTALALLAAFSILMIGPVFGMPLVGDITLHASLLFEAFPIPLLVAFLAALCLYE